MHPVGSDNGFSGVTVIVSDAAVPGKQGEPAARGVPGQLAF